MKRHSGAHTHFAWLTTIAVAWLVIGSSAVASAPSTNVWLQSFRLWNPQTRQWEEARGRAAITLLRDGETLSHHECALNDSRMELRLPEVDEPCAAILRVWSPEDEFSPYAQGYEYGTFEGVEGPRLLVDPNQVEISLYPTHSVSSRATTSRASIPIVQIKSFLNAVPRAATWNGLHVITPSKTADRVDFAWMHADTTNTYASVEEKGIGGVQITLDKAVSRFAVIVAAPEDGLLGPQLIGMENRYIGIRWELRDLANGVVVNEGTRDEIDIIHVENATESKSFALLYFGIPIDGAFSEEVECPTEKDNSLPDCECDASLECEWTVVVLSSFCEGFPGEHLPPAPKAAGGTSIATSFCYMFSSERESGVEFSGDATVILPLSWSGAVKLGGKYTGKSRRGQSESRCVSVTLAPGWATALFIKDTWCDYVCQACLRAFGAINPGCRTCEQAHEGYELFLFPRVELSSEPEPFARAMRCEQLADLTPAGTGNGRLYRRGCD